MTAALDLLAALMLDDGRRWGEAATDWQMEDARAVLDTNSNQRLHFLTRPKGGSKSTDLAGITIAWLLTQAAPLADGYALAADEEQARRLLDKVRGFVARTPALAGQLRVDQHRITAPNGAWVQTLAADVSGSEGLLTSWVVVDELPNWTSTVSARGMWTSVISAVPKRRDMRLTVIGHAGDPAHWSYKVLEGARSRPRAWHVHEVPGPLPWVTADDLAEQRAQLTDSQFARRHLNLWTAAEGRLVSAEDLAACVTLDGPQDPKPLTAYALALDIGLTNDRTVLAVAHAEQVLTENGTRPSGAVRHVPTGVKVVLDRLMVWQGTSSQPVQLTEVEAAIVAASQQYRATDLVFDPYQAAGMSQRLADRGMNVLQFNFSQASAGKLALTLHTLLRNRSMALPDDPALLDELLHVRLRETSPNVYRMDHDSDRHDDRAITLALVAQHLLARYQWTATVRERRLPPVTMQERLDEDIRRRRLGKHRRDDGGSGIMGRY